MRIQDSIEDTHLRMRWRVVARQNRVTFLGQYRRAPSVVVCTDVTASENNPVRKSHLLLSWNDVTAGAARSIVSLRLWLDLLIVNPSLASTALGGRLHSNN